MIKKIVIEVGVARSRIISFLPHELFNLLDTELSYDVQGGEYTEAYENGWDGKSHLISKKTYAFGTGLLGRVINLLKSYDYEVVLIDKRPLYSKEKLDIKDDIEYRQYQNEIADTIIKNKRCIIWAVPRSGKTLCAKKFLVDTGLSPSLFLCQSIALAEQTVNVFKDLDVGLIGDGKFSIGKNVTVATIQSYKNCLNIKDEFIDDDEKLLLKENYVLMKDMLVNFKAVIVDESHHAASNTYQQILSRCINAEYFIGFSGTPFREDNKNLLVEKALGPIVFHVDYSYLIKLKYLVPPIIYLYKLKRVHVDGKSYQTIYKDAVVENYDRNKKICDIAEYLYKLKNESVVIIVSQKKHGKLLKKIFDIKNIDAKFLYGKSETAAPEREQLIAMLGGDNKEIVISTILKEGIDMPALKNVINAAGGKSGIDVFQRFRNMTPYPGKEFCRTIDFLDMNRYLKTHSIRRESLYNSEQLFKVVYK